MIGEFEPIDHEFYTEKYEYYIEERGAEDVKLLFRAVLGTASAENSFRVTVPEEKDGIPVERVEICTRPYDIPEAAAADFPTLEYLYIPSGVSGIFIETNAQRATEELSEDENTAFVTETVNPLERCKVEISPDNPYFCVYENGIYSKDMTVLYYLFSPSELKDGRFEVPAEVKIIAPRACGALRGLRGVTVHKGVAEIAVGAFERCPDLEFADIRAKSVGIGAFEACPSLRAVRVSSVKIGIEAFCDCEKLETVELLKTGEIEGGAFCGCVSLKEIRLPESLRFIGHRAFWGAGITRLTVPYSVKKLEEEICGKNTVLEIYTKKNGVLPFEYCGKTAEIGTRIAVRSHEKGEKILFEFVLLDKLDRVFDKNGIDLSGYDEKLKNRIFNKEGDKYGFDFFRYDEIPLYRDDTETTMLAAWTRCHYPYQLDEGTREIFGNYVAEKGERFLMNGIYEGIGAGDAAEYMFLDLIGNDALLRLIDRSAEEGRTEITAALMQKLHERKKH